MTDGSIVLIVVAALAAAMGWLLHRRRRAARQAPEMPPGQQGRTASVTALQSRLAYGLSTERLFELAGTPGMAHGSPGHWRWTDERGNEIVVTVRQNKVVRWAAAHIDP